MTTRLMTILVFLVLFGVIVGIDVHQENVLVERETRACAVICGSEYVEVINPKYNRSHLCLCPATGGDGPRGPHWTLTYLDGGTP